MEWGCWLWLQTEDPHELRRKMREREEGQMVVEVEGTDGRTAESEVSGGAGEIREGLEGRTREETRATEEGGVVLLEPLF